jgi:hypothetical protein
LKSQLLAAFCIDLGALFEAIAAIAAFSLGSIHNQRSAPTPTISL